MSVAGDLPPLTVDRRYCGPPTSANGGYAAGRLATYVRTSGPVEVTLRRPPPLDAPIVVRQVSDRFEATYDGQLVAEVVASEAQLEAVDPVSFAAAQEAEAGYAGQASHPFPTCFACGTARSRPDALALRPGPVAGRPGTTAATWVPHPTLALEGVIPPEIAWAALDCPGGWTLDLEGRPAVLGRITASIDAPPEVGDECVIVGTRLARQGRRTSTSTTLYDGDGRVLARALSLWFDLI